jgi:hypothetical protein
MQTFQKIGMLILTLTCKGVILKIEVPWWFGVQFRLINWYKSRLEAVVIVT